MDKFIRRDPYSGVWRMDIVNRNTVFGLKAYNYVEYAVYLFDKDIETARWVKLGHLEVIHDDLESAMEKFLDDVRENVKIIMNQKDVLMDNDDIRYLAGVVEMFRRISEIHD